MTGLACVSRLYTDLAVVDLANGQARVVELAAGLSLADLQAITPDVTFLPPA